MLFDLNPQHGVHTHIHTHTDTHRNMKKQGNKMSLETLNSPKVDLMGTNGEELKHQMAELHKMINREQRNLAS